MGNGDEDNADEDNADSNKIATAVSNRPERRHRPRYRFSAPMEDKRR
jgi:hypothetical protein